MIRTDERPVGIAGTAWYLTRPSDLEALERRAALLVPVRTAKLFRGFPDTVVGLTADRRVRRAHTR